MAGLCSTKKGQKRSVWGLRISVCVRVWEERKGGAEGEGEGEGGLGHMIVVAIPSFVILNSLVGFWVKQPSLIWLAIKSRVLSSASVVRCDTTVRVMNK